MKKILTTLTFALLATAMMAVPAKRGVWKTLTLADGSEVHALLVGDEHGHYWKAEDGTAFMFKNGSYESVDASEVVARANARKHRVNEQRMKRLPRRVGNTRNYTGVKKGIILLVNFQDKKFELTHDNALFQRIANEEDFSEGNFKGSMSDYFKAQSLGQFELDFDVIGPLTVSKNAKYYGENDSDGNDKHAGEMVIEAVKQAMNDVRDWKQYDWDDDGYVDQVYVVYAGKSEAETGISTTIWPHAYSLSEAKRYGDGTGPVTVTTGLKVDTYACGSELDGSGGICGIGTMCHEFSHCLGYPDFYDIDYSGGQGMNSWDLMDQGSYNDDGFQPAGYTGYERWEAGWSEPVVLEDEDVTIENMKALQDGGEYYIIYNKNQRDEYYMLENRQLTGWDASLPAAGMLIIHVDYDATVWANNEPNDDPKHQRMTWIPADDKYEYEYYNGDKYYTWEGLKTDLFPYKKVNAFNKATKPAAKLYNKNANGTYYLDSSVEDIQQNTDGTMSFRFVAAYGGTGSVTPSEGVLFYESFDQCEGTGGNDDQWSGMIANSSFVPDNEGWEAQSDKMYGGDQCAKFGTSSVMGIAKTPEFELNGTATLTFKAGAWKSNSDGTTLTLEVEGGTVQPEEFTIEKGAWSACTATITGTGTVRVVFTPMKRFFLDEVLVEANATNGVMSLTTDSSSRAGKRIYTLDGRYVGTRLEGLQHGIYVVGGKKIVK